MSVALSTALPPHAAAASASAPPAPVEHQATSVDDRGGLKMKIKRKNPNGSGVTDGKTADTPDAVGGSCRVKSAGCTGGTAATSIEVGSRPVRQSETAGKQSSPETKKIAVGGVDVVDGGDSSKNQQRETAANATSKQQQNTVATKESSTAVVGRRSQGSSAGGRGGETAPSSSTGRSKVKPTGSKGSNSSGAKSRKASMGSATVSGKSDDQPQSADQTHESLNGFDSVEQQPSPHHVASSADQPGQAVTGSDTSMPAVVTKCDTLSTNVAIESSKKEVGVSGGQSTSGAGPRPVVDPYEFESVGSDVMSDAAAGIKPEVLSGPRHLSTHKQQQQHMKSSSIFNSEPPSSACSAVMSPPGDDSVTAPIRCDVAVDTLSVGVTTDPDYLGPCEPGTSVVLEGIVWSESNNGILVVNVTWRGKTYVGTLMDSTRHDWAPPRFRDDSPSSDEHTRGWRGSAGGSSAAGTPDVTTEGRRLRKCRRDNGGGGTRGRQPPDDRRRATETVAAKKARTSNSTAAAASAAGSGTSTVIVDPQFVECPEPNCSKKFREASGLSYHQSHAHRKLPVDTDSNTDTTAGGGASARLPSTVPGSRSKHVTSSTKRSTASSTATSTASETSVMGRATAAEPSKGASMDVSGKRPRSVNDIERQVDEEEETAVACKKPRVCQSVENHQGPDGQLQSSADNVGQVTVEKSHTGNNPVKVQTVTEESNAKLNKEKMPLSSVVMSENIVEQTAVARLDSVLQVMSNGIRTPHPPQNDLEKTPVACDVGSGRRIKDQQLLGCPSTVSAAGGEAISPAYSDISDSNNTDVDERGAGGLRASREHLVKQQQQPVAGVTQIINGPDSVIRPPSRELAVRTASDASRRTPPTIMSSSQSLENNARNSSNRAATAEKDWPLLDRRQQQQQGLVPPAISVTPPAPSQQQQQQLQGQQQAAALEFIQMESMRQAYLQMFGAAGAQPAVLPYGYPVDPATAYRMQLMAAAAASGRPALHPSAVATAAQYERLLAEQNVAQHRANGPAAPGSISADAKPVDMSAKRCSVAVTSDRSPSGSVPQDSFCSSNMMGRTPTPASAAAMAASSKPATARDFTESGQYRGGSAGLSSRQKASDLVSTVGRSSSNSLIFDGCLPPRGSADTVHMSAVDGAGLSRQHSIIDTSQSSHQRHRNTNTASSSSSTSGRLPAITPKTIHEDDSSKSSRWTTSKDGGGRAGDPSPTSPTGMPASPGLGAGLSGTNSSNNGRHRDESSPLTKRHMHNTQQQQQQLSHHQTHLINSPFSSIYGLHQYNAATTLLSATNGVPPLVPAAASFPDVYNPK